MANVENTCCICGKKFNGHGNNSVPVKDGGLCCDKCNLEIVIPVRIDIMLSNK